MLAPASLYPLRLETSMSFMICPSVARIVWFETANLMLRGGRLDSIGMNM